MDIIIGHTSWGCCEDKMRISNGSMFSLKTLKTDLKSTLSHCTFPGNTHYSLPLTSSILRLNNLRLVNINNINS